MDITLNLLMIIYFGIVLFALNILSTFQIMDNKDIKKHEQIFYFSPIFLYKKTKMNILGCIIGSILLFSINYLYCSIVLIGRLFYIISHIGRRK